MKEKRKRLGNATGNQVNQNGTERKPWVQRWREWKNKPTLKANQKGNKPTPTAKLAAKLTNAKLRANKKRNANQKGNKPIPTAKLTNGKLRANKKRNANQNGTAIGRFDGILTET